jgi:hypothetical protein
VEYTPVFPNINFAPLNTPHRLARGLLNVRHPLKVSRRRDSCVMPASTFVTEWDSAIGFIRI